MVLNFFLTKYHQLLCFFFQVQIKIKLAKQGLKMVKNRPKLDQIVVGEQTLPEPETKAEIENILHKNK